MDHEYATRKVGNYQAQHGEDRWLERYFASTGPGFFVEVGAYDGVVLSNTYLLETIGWRGILVEPDPDKAALCRANRPACRVFECAAAGSEDQTSIDFHAVEGGAVYSTTTMTPHHAARIREWGLRHRTLTVQAKTLNSMLADVQPPSVSFVSIDVEEGELEVLRGFDLERWRPRMVMVETNTRFRNRDVRNFFRQRGYAFFHAIGWNDIYVPLTELRWLATTVDSLLYASSKSRSMLQSAVRNALQRAAHAIR